MSVTYGFYDSLNGDRKYSSKQFSSLFDGVIKDGVFANIGDAFKVSTDGVDMSVNVGTGRAWFNHTWTLNDATLSITVDQDLSNNRIDTIVIDVDVANRTNDIKLIKGTASSSPVAPTFIIDDVNQHYQYPICNIYVTKGASVIASSNITYLVGADYCPFVSSALDHNMINALIMRWETEWEHQNAEQQAEFDAFMADLQSTLDADVAGNLTNRIIALETKTESLSPSAILNRNTFRGKHLGTTITDSQLRNIRNGSFKDLCIGDYWEHYGIKWRIVDINYWLNTGSDTKCTTNHIVVMPDEPIGDTAYLNETETGIAYYNSLIRNRLTSIKTGYAYAYISNWLGSKVSDVLLNHREYLVNTVASGFPSTGAWYDSTVELPSEIMMYGTRVYSPGNTGAVVPCLYTNSRTQLALFRLAPQYIQAGNSYFWLRDIVDNTRYAAVSSDGEASWRKVVKETGIRPVFGITGGSERAEWLIGSDLSGHTLLCSERLTTNTSFNIQYEHGSEFYTLAYQYGCGGANVELNVHLANGHMINIKDGYYHEAYDEVTVCDKLIYREFNSDSSSFMDELFNIESDPLPEGSIITSFQFIMSDLTGYWDDDDYAVSWLNNNIAIKS